VPFTHYYELLVPANTTFANRKRKGGPRLPPGTVIKSIVLYVPPGVQSESPIWWERRGAKILPTDGGEIALDGVNGQELLARSLRLEGSGELELVGYNKDAVNDHTTRAIVVGLYPEEVEPGAA
jgi:hypothetical protein